MNRFCVSVPFVGRRRPAPPLTAGLPAADGLLHVYNLPVGQGDAQILQCPSGQLNIIDMGSNQWPKREAQDERFWGAEEIKVSFMSLNYCQVLLRYVVCIFFCFSLSLVMMLRYIVLL